jgi:hypothetical protein
MHGLAAAKIKVVGTATTQTLIATACTEGVVDGFSGSAIRFRSLCLLDVHQSQVGFLRHTSETLSHAPHIMHHLSRFRSRDNFGTIEEWEVSDFSGVSDTNKAI